MSSALAQIVKFLIDSHADVNTCALNGFTPLHVACYHKYPNTVSGVHCNSCGALEEYKLLFLGFVAFGGRR